MKLMGKSSFIFLFALFITGGFVGILGWESVVKERQMEVALDESLDNVLVLAEEDALIVVFPEAGTMVFQQGLFGIRARYYCPIGDLILEYWHRPDERLVEAVFRQVSINDEDWLISYDETGEEVKRVKLDSLPMGDATRDQTTEHTETTEKRGGTTKGANFHERGGRGFRLVPPSWPFGCFVVPAGTD